MITWDPFFRWQTSKHWTTWHTLSHCVPWCVKCKCPQSLISLSLSSNPVQSTSPTTPSCMPCSMMAKWQNTYWSGICILKARCDRMRRTVSLMLTVCMCSNLRRLMSVVINVPVLPIPALQCTTMGGPRAWPCHSDPRELTASSWQARTLNKNSRKAAAELGVP